MDFLFFMCWSLFICSSCDLPSFLTQGTTNLQRQFDAPSLFCYLGPLTINLGKTKVWSSMHHKGPLLHINSNLKGNRMKSPKHTYLGVWFVGPQLKTCFPTITQHGLWFCFPSKELVLPESIPKRTIGVRLVDPWPSMIQRYKDPYCFIPTRLKKRECNLLCYNTSFGASEQSSNASSR